LVTYTDCSLVFEIWLRETPERERERERESKIHETNLIKTFFIRQAPRFIHT
ncbi:GSCOCG00004319001-RA-CDS, partial [Cotesia congregata]